MLADTCLECRGAWSTVSLSNELSAEFHPYETVQCVHLPSLTYSDTWTKLISDNSLVLQVLYKKEFSCMIHTGLFCKKRCNKQQFSGCTRLVASVVFCSLFGSIYPSRALVCDHDVVLETALRFKSKERADRKSPRTCATPWTAGRGQGVCVTQRTVVAAEDVGGRGEGGVQENPNFRGT